MNRPNLFHYATSELSQDAVLCWLLKWADDRFRGQDEELHAAGVAFLRMLFEKAAKASGMVPPPAPFDVQIKRQFERIDVVALINDSHVVVIEDKVHAKEGGDQLSRYRRTIDAEFPERVPLFVFLKTGDQAGYGSIEDQGWHPVTRSEVLETLRPFRASVTDSIFIDFFDHLKAREDAVLSFKTTPIGSWRVDGPDPYKGFYEELRSDLPSGDWGYVANPNSGFWGFWWSFLGIGGGDQIYLQIEEDKLVVKISVGDRDERRQKRDFWSTRIRENLIGFERPKRLGFGRTMTIAENGNFRLTNSSGIIDIDGTAKLLSDFAESLEQLVCKRSVC